jgi:two-component system, NtrC family, nitrogen regulation sensor histidine kinase NtrY
MTLALRLLVAFGLLALLTTGLVGYGVRGAWVSMERQNFADQLEAAKNSARETLDREAQNMRGGLGPVCAHGPYVDQTLIDLERHELDQGRRLAVREEVRAEMKARALDELLLFTAEGEILGAGRDPAAVGKKDAKLAAELSRPLPMLALENATMVTRCVKRFGGQAVALRGELYLGPFLERIGRSYGVRLAIAGPGKVEASADEDAVAIPLETPELQGVRLLAFKSRRPLEQHLASLDERILLASALSVAVAIVGAILLARNLARPIEELAVQAREVVRGEPRPVKARGGKELRELERAFNQAIEDLTSLRKRLARTERIAARREIARQVAHEIKNPLAPIRAAVETLRRLRARQDPAFDDYFDEATRTVLDEVFRITKIVSEFTEFARLPPPKPGPVQLEEVARSVVGLYVAGGAEVALEATPCPTIQADRDQLVQVLTNLIQNGLEAAGSAGGDPQRARVRVRIEPGGSDRVVIVVADSGPGVSPEMLSRLFEPYATSKPDGTGLGLAIVQRIVQEHGGEITYEKQSVSASTPPGRGPHSAVDGPSQSSPSGAVFRIVLPVTGPSLLATQGDVEPGSLKGPRG